VSVPRLVQQFYERIWEAGDLDAAEALLAPDFAFRGSLGDALRGRAAFIEYVRGVRGALSGYRCEILDCVAEGDRAFARMRFSGRHTAPLRGHGPTGKEVHWLGAALFRFEGPAIAELWVLGDLAGLDALLRANAADARH
jgi:predicted ester cyclase